MNPNTRQRSRTEQLAAAVKLGPRALISLTVVAICSVVAAVAPTVARADSTTPAHFNNVPLASWRPQGVGWSVLLANGVVYVGGSFSSVLSPNGSTSVGRANLAAFDASTGALLTTFRADTNGTVYALGYDGTNVYVGGAFNSVDGSSRPHIAAVDPVTGAVRSNWRASVSSNVYALSAAAGKVYIGGSFSSVNGIHHGRAAALNAGDGSVDSSFNPDANDTVKSIAAQSDGSHVYIGGRYTTVNGVASRYLTQLSNTGAVLRTSWASLSGLALGLQVSDDGTRLAVAAGDFANQGDWYNTSTGQRLWFQRCDGDAQAVHIIDGSMFTGFHEACNGDTNIRFTSNVTATGVRDTAFHPSFDLFYGVRAISGDTSNLVVAGEFTRISGVAVRGFAIFPPA